MASHAHCQQDWEPLVLRRRQPKKPTARTPGISTEAVRKAYGGANRQHVVGDGAHVRKVADDECETFAHATVRPGVAQAIQRARQAKAWTQRELATRINERAAVVQQYENKQAVPNDAVLAKMERALGVRLRGKRIGEPFGGAKASATPATTAATSMTTRQSRT